jgi:hypothetical protein
MNDARARFPIHVLQAMQHALFPQSVARVDHAAMRALRSSKMTLFDFARNHCKQVVIKQHTTTRLDNGGQALFIFLIHDGLANDACGAGRVFHVDGDKALSREIVRGIGATRIKRQGHAQE